MKKYNLVLVYDQNNEKLLMCKRKKEPYKGKFNLVGGKIEPNEIDIESAYRELEEETGITNKDIQLKHLMNLQYIVQDMELEVFVGNLNKDVKLIEEVNELIWINKEEDFYNLDKYAGEGNIWHMVKHANKYMNI